MRHVFVVVVDTPEDLSPLRTGYNPQMCDRLVSEKMAELSVHGLRFVTGEIFQQDWEKPVKDFFPEKNGL